MAHLIGMAIFLAGLWLALSGYLLGWLLALGGASVALTVWIVHRMEVSDQEAFPIHLSPRIVTYYPWLAKEIVLSNIVVAKAIISGRIQPEVFTVDATQDSELGHVVYANSITLTPGTITTGVEDARVTVHALLKETADGVRGGEMDRRISHMTNSRKRNGAAA
ncbi:MAG: Na+/H+ antiporter subunit E [Rhodospirillales bacterium]